MVHPSEGTEGTDAAREITPIVWLTPDNPTGRANTIEKDFRQGVIRTVNPEEPVIAEEPEIAVVPHPEAVLAATKDPEAEELKVVEATVVKTVPKD